MILDRIENRKVYSGVNEGVNKVLEIAEGITSETYPTERLYIDGDKLFINFPAYETHSKKDGMTEAHRQYVDVMYMVEGSETIYVKDVNALKKVTKEYDPAIEALLADVDDDATAVRLEAGSFIVLFPEDAHAPACDPVEGRKTKVKKLIGKVLL